LERELIFEVTLKKFLQPVGRFLEDDTVSEVMINGPHEVYIERGGMVEKAEVSFDDEELLLAAARNIAQYTNKRVTPLTARFDSRLPDGSRVHVVMPRCSRKGLCISIRKFSRKSFTLEGLTEGGSLTPEAKEYIEVVINLERNIIVSGGTGSGKTSLLNAISAKIPPSERIIVIEDTAELQLQQPHVLNFETAAADRHAQGAVTIRDLFHSALRMRPDRIVIGECRGGEALDLIQAMTSGHGGSMSTLHANNAADALGRLETMALMSGIDIPLYALRSQVASAIDLVIQLNRMSDGRRLVTEISEVGQLGEGGGYQVTRIFGLTEAPAAGPGMGLRWTGATSAFLPYIREKGIAGSIRLTRKIFSPASDPAQ